MALTDQLLSWWKLDEATGSSRSDSVGGRTLTDVGTVDATAGIIGNAALFSGSDYLSRATGGTGRIGISAWSMSYWIRRESTAGVTSPFTEFSLTGGGLNYIYSLNSLAEVRCYISDGVTINNSGNNVGGVPLNTWSHHVWVFDGTQIGNSGRLIMYRDGVLQTLTYGGTIPTSMASGVSAGSFYLGSGVAAFVGRLDLFGLWSRPLSAAEITQLYNAGAGLDYPFSSSHPYYYRNFVIGDDD